MFELILEITANCETYLVSAVSCERAAAGLLAARLERTAAPV
jgi:hypothetical protein